MLQSLYERLRDSLFALPALLIAALGSLSWLARRIDATLPLDTNWLLTTTVDSTRSILSTVAAATITVSGIVFSMTAVVVQLATSQLSPRVTQGFLRDRYQQVTIGVNVGTFVYALLVLSDVHGTEEIPFSRHDFSVTLSVALGVTSMILIVLFIDRTMRNLRIDTVIRWLSEQTIDAITSLPDREPPSIEEGGLPSEEPGSSVEVSKTGWVVAIDFDEIMRAIPASTVARLDLRVGDFIVRREVAARTWPAIDPAAQEGLARAVKVARTRSIATDPAYGLRQMVDIALRALSAAINDPTTASDVIRHLGGPLQTLLLRDLTGRVMTGPDDRRLYLPRELSHSEYVHNAFREIRLYANGKPHVLLSLIETLASLISVVERAELSNRAGALRAEGEATLSMIENSALPDADQQALFDFARRVGLERPD